MIDLEWLLLFPIGIIGFKLYTAYINRQNDVQEEISQTLPSDDGIAAIMSAKRSFIDITRALNLTIKSTANSLFLADGPNFSVSLSIRSFSSHEHSLCISVPQCINGPTFTSPFAEASDNAKRLLTSDAAFDAVIALRKPHSADPHEMAFVSLFDASTRAAFVVAADYARFHLTQGTFDLTSLVTPSTLTTAVCARRIQDALDLARRLIAPANPCEMLAHIATTDTAAPGLQLHALRALAAHPQRIPSQVADTCNALLANANLSSKLRLQAAIFLGDAGLPYVQSCLLSPDVPNNLHATALDHLLTGLPDSALKPLIDAEWPKWLRVGGSVSLLKAALRALKRFPAPGRLDALSVHLDRHDLSVYILLLETIDAQPDPTDLIERALLPHLPSTDLMHLNHLTPILEKHGGPLTAASLKEIIASETDTLRKNTLEIILNLIQTSLAQRGTAGQLALVSDAESGALSLSDPPPNLKQ